MKRFLTALLLAALLLCAGGALAQMDDAASMAITADLYATPREGAQVLMTYYPGVRVEVLREVNTGFVQVNVGREGGSLTGYMRKADLVFGEEAIRQNRPLEVCYEQLSWTLYSYCDTRSEVLIECGDTTLYVMGECGDWVHATVDRGSEVITGFVNRKASGLREADRTTGYAAGIRTQPTADEPTREDAVAAARAHILADGIEANGVGGPITAELLDSCTVQVDMGYTYDTGDVPGESPLWYMVTYVYADRTWEDGLPMICGFCVLYVWDGEFVGYDYGKG